MLNRLTTTPDASQNTPERAKLKKTNFSGVPQTPTGYPTPTTLGSGNRQLFVQLFSSQIFFISDTV